jgi:DNA-directed RNA polymerase subunit RPC12/RpoP
MNEEQAKEKYGIYVEHLDCTNCGHKQVAEIAKGTSISHYTIHKACERCGCRTLQKSFR